MQRARPGHYRTINQANPVRAIPDQERDSLSSQGG